MKKSLIFLLILSIIISFSACKGEDTDDITDGTIVYDEDFIPANKDILIWENNWQRVLTKEVCEQLMDEFPAYNDGFTLKIVSGTTLESLMAAIQSNTQPDLLSVGKMEQYYYADAIQPLDNYLNNDPQVNKESLHKVSLEVLDISGKMYGISGQANLWMLVYNKDMFADAGLDPETPPKTWQEMLAIQRNLTKYDSNGKIIQAGFIDFIGTPIFTSIYSILYKGVDPFQTGRYRINMNTESMEKTIQWFRDMEAAMGGRSNFVKGFNSTRPDSFRKGYSAMMMGLQPRHLLYF